MYPCARGKTSGSAPIQRGKGLAIAWPIAKRTRPTASVAQTAWRMTVRTRETSCVPIAYAT